MNKSNKFGFNIKLSEETAQKLQTVADDLEDICRKTEDDVASSSTETPQDNIASSSAELQPLKNESEGCISNDLKKDEIGIEIAPGESIVDIESSKDVCESNDSNDGDKYTSFKEYSQYIHYEEGVAIYTDPSNNLKYIWCTTKNEWTLKDDNTTESQSAENREVIYENGVATYKDKDGVVYIWDSDKNAWFPKIDDDFMAQYQMSYGFIDNSNEIANDTNNEGSNDANDSGVNNETKGIKRKVQEDPKWFDISDEKNTSVYVANLPLDITEEEFVDLMQKCGLVMRDPVTQKMKIKLYTKPNSKQLKGDGLCTYIKIESVELALNILDGYMVKNHRIKVQKAHFQMKGEYNPALKPKKKKRKEKEKIKKMQEQLFDWRPEKFRGERSKHEKVVIIKNLFEPSIFDKEVHLILEYQEDLREECSKLGEVRKVFLYDRHPQGVAQISMKEPEEADAVVKLLNGRWFGKRQLTAEIWDGKTKYKMEETDADLNKRISTWENFLEEKDKS